LTTQPNNSAPRDGERLALATADKQTHVDSSWSRTPNAIESFREAIEAAGGVAPETIDADGLIHRFSSTGRRGDDSGWYVLHLDGVPAGAFGDWREGTVQTWCGSSYSDMTAVQREAHRLRIKHMQVQRVADRLRSRADAAYQASITWQEAVPAIHHDYLTHKGIQAHSVRTDGHRLVVAMRDTAGQLHSLQTISPDGEKRFLSCGRVRGCYFSIGHPRDRLIVCEGFATGATIHEATGHAVAVAFSSNNLAPVSVALRRKYPFLSIIVAADDDWRTPANPGRMHAKAAALAVGGVVAIPIFPSDRPEKATDFNDLHAIAGLDAVRTCFAEVLETEGAAA
jgi:putative DNA primase/helicase